MDPSSKPGSSRSPIAKINALARFKSFTDSLTPRRPTSTFSFPPPSWEIDKLNIDSVHGWDNTGYEPPTRTPSMHEAIAKVGETVVSTEVPAFPEDEPEPLTFAQRIRDLITLLPSPSASWTKQPGVYTPLDGPAMTAEDGTIGPPVPLGVDHNLVKMLSSEEVMNGDEEREGDKAERKSIWKILSSMRWPGKESEDLQEQTSEFPSTAQDGVMMYAPLEPKNDSQLELAEHSSVIGSPPDSNHPPSPEQQQSEEHIEWVPSTTHISVYVSWWGYRLYLPPPVMVTLDSTSLKATGKAAMITASLKWLLDQIPEILVPAQFRVPLKLLKRLGPAVGYIGVVVAWSWGRIKSHDQGNGVVLTATWLLPVALIPMAWDAGDVYKPVLLPNPEDRISTIDQQRPDEPTPPVEDKQSQEQDTGKKKRFWHL